jgi:hypothetical protein
VDEIVRRAGRDDYDRWAEQVARCGHCARPVRLRGYIDRPDGTGYSTDTEPDRVLLIRCGNRRASACPSCSYEYAGDMWQLLYAGAAGGRKGVPESIRAHPLVFATLTAPGFGPVHGTRTDRHGTTGARCRPPRGRATPCPHHRPTWCSAIHTDADEQTGQPLCGDCYDYPAHAAFNWWAPELWRRFTITLRRVLARRAGLTPAAFTRQCRVSFVKVAEFQRRAVVHFHALIRLDAAGDGFTPPPVPLDAADLADAIGEAAAAVRLTVDLPTGPVELRFGEQTDTQPINCGTAGELTPERVAAYIAKYATKSAEDFGLGDRRQTGPALAGDGVTEHIARLLQTCWQLEPNDGYAGLRRWLHMAGFRGHFASKSRRYSTTLGAIRSERRTYRRRQDDERARQLGYDRAADDDTTLVISRWEFAGLGYLTGGDAALALSAAARARERRQTGREEITTIRRRW